MLAVSRAEIEAYLAQNGLSHVTDSTNFLPDARRNRLRQSVIPLLKAENPSLCETAFRMCQLLEADEAQLSAQAEVPVLQQARLADGVQCGILAAYPRPFAHAPSSCFLVKSAHRSFQRGISTPLTGCCFLRVHLPAYRCRADFRRSENMTGCFLPLTPLLRLSQSFSQSENLPFFNRLDSAFSANGKKIFQKFKIHSPLLL